MGAINLMQCRAMAAIALTLTGCGGSGDGANQTTNPPVVTVTIGGTVSGLVGAVRLRNNGADDLTITGDGAFTFATALNGGVAYAVSIATQPANQTCAITNGAGTTGTANITNVVVSCSTPMSGGSGSLDPSFGTGGKLTTDFSGAPAV